MSLECIDCGGTPIEAFGRCASCNSAARKAERNSKKIKIIQQPNKVSEKRAEELKEYIKLKKEFLSFKNACELMLPGCFVSASDVHHNSLSSTNFLNTDTWIAVCRNCHRRLETEMSAEERRLLGLLTN